MSATTVLAWLSAGELTGVNVARTARKRARWRIDPDDLEQFIATRRTRPKVAPRPRRRLPPVTNYV